MDKITRDFLSMLLRHQHGLSESQVIIMKQVFSISQGVSTTMKAVGEVLALVCQVEDPEKRRAALDSLWTAIDQTEIQSELSRKIAHLESAHEVAEAQIESLIANLGNLKLDDE